MSEEKKDVPAVQESYLPASLPSPTEFREIFAENCEGLTPTFETITIPAGGGVSFHVIGEDGDPDDVKEIEGVILDHYPTRAYWSTPMGGTGTGMPPDCSSKDGLVGSLPRNLGGEFGKCVDCKFAQFGTDIKEGGILGRGQACKLVHRVFILPKGQESIFPKMLALPPTSQGRYDGGFTGYAVKLAGRMKRLGGVVTKVKLTTDRNKDGVSFSKAMFFFVADLSDGDKAKIEALRAGLKEAMRGKPIEDDGAAAPAGNAAAEEKEPWEE